MEDVVPGAFPRPTVEQAPSGLSERSSLSASLATQATHFLLEADHYTNPKWAEIEQRQIFEKTWLYVGDSAQLKPGQVWSIAIAHHPIVITCVAPGEFKAFHNVCPHRAALLCPTDGICTPKHLVCPYHGWVYDLEGTLVGTPTRHQFPPDFDRTAYPLQPIRLDIWSGFLFVSFSSDPPDLKTFLGNIPEQVGHHRQSTTQLLWQQTRQVACNWKNYHDNTLCDYHVAIAHRKTLHQLQGPVKHYTHEFSDYTNVLFTPPPQPWANQNTILPTLPTFAQTYFLTYGIFPNLHLLAFPNGLLAWIHITPLTVARCTVQLEIYGVPDLSPPIDQLRAEFHAFMAEDIALTESVQKGYASGCYTPGPVNGLETRIIHQQALILNALGDFHQ